MDKLMTTCNNVKSYDFYFFWNSYPNPYNQKKPQWTPYKLQYNFYLEENYQKFLNGDDAILPEIGDYYIQFEDMIQIHKMDAWRQRPIIRTTKSTLRNIFRKDRIDDSLNLNEISKIKPKIVEEKVILNKISYEFSKDDYNLKAFSIIKPDDVILDVLKEHDTIEFLEKLDYINYLKFVKQEIQNLSVKEGEINYYEKVYLSKITKQNFYETIIRMYSAEGFLYKSINKILSHIKYPKDIEPIKYYNLALIASIQKCSEYSFEKLKLLKYFSDGKVFVYRKIEFTQKEAENFNKKNSFRIINNFLTTYLNKNKLIENLEDNEFLMEIEVDTSFTQNFIFLDEYTEFKSEKAILIKSGSVILFHGLKEEFFDDLKKTIKLIKCSLISLDLGGMFKYLKYDTSITKIHLNDNNLGYNLDLVRILSESLKYNKSLLFLGLDWNYLGNSRESMRKLSDALKMNKTLKEINLNSNNLGSNTETIIFLSDAIALNDSIDTIYLSNNNLGNDTTALKALYEAFKINTSLKKIFLLKNKLGSNIEAIKYLSDAIITNSSINEIDLRDNNINSNIEAMILLNAAIKVKSSVKLIY